MKLPAVALVAAFAGGILLGFGEVVTAGAATAPYPELLGAGIFLLLVAALVLAWRDWLWSAAVLSLLCGTGLGFLGGVLTPIHFLRSMCFPAFPRSNLRFVHHCDGAGHYETSPLDFRGATVSSSA
jgi:hypothetical protein